MLALLLPTNLLNLSIPLFGISASPESGLENGLLVETDYWDAFRWIDRRGDRDSVVLAAPTISVWIPAYTPARVVYGHEYETVPAEERQERVEAWYHGADCTTLTSNAVPFHVDYIFWGPQERALVADDAMTALCVESLPA